MLGSFALGQQALGAFADSSLVPDLSHIASPTGVGGYANAWQDHWRDKRRRDRREAVLLATIRASEGYKRAQRKLRMLQEHLDMAEENVDARMVRIVRGKIGALENEIRMMERLD
jgi:hypothetical protein